MSRTVIHANLQDGLRQTFLRMRERRIRHMPVLDASERLVGIISDRDLRRPDWADEGPNVGHYYLLDNSRKVEDAMTVDPIVVSPDDSVAHAVDLLARYGFGALPVVTAQLKVVGMVSSMDLLRAFQDSLSQG
jgi:acetoin utilization protein AcuB